LVIRYGFLWSHERASGLAEAAKERPCAIVLAANIGVDGEVGVVVAPITHRPPADPAASLEIPPAVCRTLGLDAGRHWLRLEELNRFAWPGFDLRSIPGRDGEMAYGMLPPALFERLRQGILGRQRARAVRVQPRD
jgi:hypothetical protein